MVTETTFLHNNRDNPLQPAGAKSIDLEPPIPKVRTGSKLQLEILKLTSEHAVKPKPLDRTFVTRVFLNLWTNKESHSRET